MSHATPTPALDPVSLEIARNRLESVAEEMGTALIRTSYSPNIKDRRDCSAGIYTREGELNLRIIGRSAGAICRAILEQRLVGDYSHALYLGRELQKAESALILDRDYEQDRPLDF